MRERGGLTHRSLSVSSRVGDVGATAALTEALSGHVFENFALIRVGEAGPAGGRVVVSRPRPYRVRFDRSAIISRPRPVCNGGRRMSPMNYDRDVNDACEALAAGATRRDAALGRSSVA